MKRITAAIVAAALAAVGMAMTDDEPQDREQRDQKNPSAFLQQFVGEWSADSYAVMEPGEDPYHFEGKENARMLGGQWLVSEFVSEVEGVTLNSILTIGYDPAKEKFVATYVNAMQTRLWTYEGTLDEEGTTLTLNTEGPFMGDPTRTAEFRVLIKSKDADEWSMSSQIHMPEDDEWVEFLRFEYQRKE